MSQINLNTNVIGACLTELRTSAMNEIYIMIRQDDVYPVNGSEELVEYFRQEFAQAVKEQPGLDGHGFIEQQFVQGGFTGSVVEAGDGYTRGLLSVNDVVLEIHGKVINRETGHTRLLLARANAGVVLNMEQRVSRLEQAVGELVGLLRQQVQVQKARSMMARAAQPVKPQSATQAMVQGAEQAVEQLAAVLELTEDAAAAVEVQEVPSADAAAEAESGQPSQPSEECEQEDAAHESTSESASEDVTAELETAAEQDASADSSPEADLEVDSAADPVAVDADATVADAGAGVLDYATADGSEIISTLWLLMDKVEPGTEKSAMHNRAQHLLSGVVRALCYKRDEGELEGELQEGRSLQAQDIAQAVQMPHLLRLYSEGKAYADEHESRWLQSYQEVRNYLKNVLPEMAISHVRQLHPEQEQGGEVGVGYSSPYGQEEMKQAMQASHDVVLQTLEPVLRALAE